MCFGGFFVGFLFVFFVNTNCGADAVVFCPLSLFF